MSIFQEYDPTNVFARILGGDLPCDKVYEDDKTLAFHDINPSAPVHILVLPKRPCISFLDFVNQAPTEEVASFFKTIARIAEQVGLASHGFRLSCNTGEGGGQEVPHFHVHLCGGLHI